MSKPRIVITGVAGFIGSNLAARLLAEGYEVVGVDARPPQLGGLSFVSMDISYPIPETLFRPGDVVYHLAAMTDLAACERDPARAAAVNTLGTVNVIEAAFGAGVSRVIYAETSALYEGIASWPTPEKRINPRSAYATSKAAARLFAQLYAVKRGLPLVALRYFNVYGPGQPDRATPPVMAAFIRSILAGRPPVIYGDGRKRRDFLHVDDVNDLHVQLIDDDRALGQTYNVGSGVSSSMRDLYRRIAALLDWTGGYLSAPDRGWEAQETLADITAARGLGWEPRIGLDEGLCQQIAWERQRLGVPV